MKCFLHIGTEKTATTTLQNFLHLNRSKLETHGFIYTKSAGPINNLKLPILAYKPDRRDDITKLFNLDTDELLIKFQAEVFQNLQKELKETSKFSKIIFSSEHVQSRLRTHEDILRLKNILLDLGMSEFSIIVYLRDPVEIVNSLSSTAIKVGHISLSTQPYEDQYRYNLCNHKNTIQLFSSVFGEESVVPRLFLASDLKNASIIDDFLECIRVPCRGCENYEIPQNKNRSLSITGLEILKRINEKIPRFINDKLNPIRSDIVDFFENHFSESKYFMGKEMVLRYQQAFKDSNEWVREKYFPEKSSLFPLKEYPQETKSQIPQDELNRLATLISDIWIEKQLMISQLQHLPSQQRKLIEMKDRTIAQQRQSIKMKDSTITQQRQLIEKKDRTIAALRGSYSWKITRPLRKLKRQLESLNDKGNKNGSKI